MSFFVHFPGGSGFGTLETGLVRRVLLTIYNSGLISVFPSTMPEVVYGATLVCDNQEHRRSIVCDD